MLRSIFFLLISGLALAESLPQGRTFRILHVMSFDSPYRWTDGQLAGFKAGLGADVAAEYQVLQLDVKRNNTRQAKQQKAEEAKALIAAWQPDLLYTSDDDAQEWVARPQLNGKLPIVFSGVNKSPADHGFDAATNVTGALEREHFVETVRLLQKLDPRIQRLAVISDDGPQFVPALQRIRDNFGKLPGLRLVAMDTTATFADFQKKVQGYQTAADAIVFLGVFTLRDQKGKSVPYEEVQKWVVEHSKLPDCSFWIDRIHFGTLAAVTVSEQEQGLAAGRLARSILLEGQTPQALPMRATNKGYPAISLARARQLGLTVKSAQLLSSEVIPSYQWSR